MRRIYEGDRREARRQAAAVYRAANTEAARASWRRSEIKRLTAQAGRPKPEVCDVCGGKGNYQGKERICFDHCHQTGEFRGWLCDTCNLLLGKARDNPELLRKLADYLEGKR